MDGEDPLLDPVARADDAPTSRRWARRLLLLAVAFACAVAIVRLVGRIDWGSVAAALDELAPWHFAILLGLLILRQVLNAMPLALFIEGLGAFRATVNDLTAILLSMIAPPPSDMVMRITMFKSWGIDASRGVAGAVMNTVSFYIIRFAAPLLGILLLLPVRFDLTYAVPALVCLVLAAAILLLVLAVVRAERLAVRIGTTAARFVGRFRPSVDPAKWAAACVQFRVDMQRTFARGFPRALADLVAMVLVDGLLLLAALRFVGVDRGDVGALEIVAAYLIAYPLTIFPLQGLGVLDAVVLAALVDVGGLQIEPMVVAGLIVWRVVTIIAPVLMGVGSLAWWRRWAARQGTG